MNRSVLSDLWARRRRLPGIALSNFAVFFFLLVLAFGADVALAAEKRIALVIGNARYPALALNNPENDARVVATTLRRLGFEVSEHVNLPIKEFRKVLRDYAKRLQSEEGTSVFYYAGHGVQIEGRNYLLPVDVNLRDEDEVRDEGVDVDELFISRLERARTQVRIVILDACRDNPFGPKTRAIRGSGGLAEMAARGTLMAYAAAPGSTAEDGPAGTNSVYTRHLVKEMLVEGIEVEQMFKNVRVKVVRDTNQRQVPWVNTSLTANFSFNPKRGPAEDVAKRDELGALQAKLEEREREQKKLEEELARVRKKYEPPSGDGARVTAPVTSLPKDLPVAVPAPSRKQSGTVTAAPAPVSKGAEPAPAAAPAPATAATRKDTAAPTAPAAAPATAKAATQPAASPTAAAKAAAAAERAELAKPKAAPQTSTVAARPERSDRAQPAAPVPDAAVSQTPAKAARPAERVAKAPGGGNAASERCVALLIRAQLGEPMPPAEMAYLQKECR
jgi:hypothetical protein